MNNKIMILNRFLTALVLLTLAGCSRDDLCPEGAAITPDLVITFNSFSNPNLRKSVNALSVETDYEDSTVILSQTVTDFISIPLNVNADYTRYRFIKTSVVGTDTLRRSHKIEFSYQRRSLYVNRACGFRIEFDNMETDVEDRGSENWIRDIKVIKDTIIDENQAHITIFH